MERSLRLDIAGLVYDIAIEDGGLYEACLDLQKDFPAQSAPSFWVEVKVGRVQMPGEISPLYRSPDWTVGWVRSGLCLLVPGVKGGWGSLGIYRPRERLYFLRVPREGGYSFLKFNLRLLTLLLLGQEGGVMLHACGIEKGGEGYLFLGPSGSGKTTVACLLYGSRLLSDELVIVRPQGSHFLAFGTPWYGSFPRVYPQGVGLGKLLFLTRGPLFFVPLSPPKALRRLLVNAQFATWDEGATQKTLQLLADLSRKVPAYDMHFTLEDDIWRGIDALR